MKKTRRSVVTMKVAAVIAPDGESVSSLVGGPVIRIRDTNSGEELEVPNPAISAASHRRIAALQAILGQGAETVVNPPGTFCAHSYQLARNHTVKFWDVPEGTSWTKLWRDHPVVPENLSVEISEDHLASGHQHHHH